ncbi:Protein trapped in endoderm-1 [Frankliniella fusca]|uniref:Protein trapped in endoderm-1 n=1 Tax=Frankliniella fusca TaxID=407009 RepID=A0AAE1HAG6_9NEOP|nr:Protein trapped in endoderm-1 [Frankliniella fusca]
MASCGAYNWTRHEELQLLDGDQLQVQQLLLEDAHPTLYSRPASLFAAACAMVFTLVGVPGNLITVLALARSPALRAHATTAFIISLCTSDLVFCALCLPPTAARFLLARWPLGPLACAVFPLLFYGNVAVSVLSMTAIAINRYILIMWHGVYARLYSRPHILLMVLLVWVAGFSLLVPPLLGVWGCLGLEPRSFSCTILKKDGASPKKIFFVVGFALPCTVMAAAYSCIYWRVRRSRAALKAHGTSGSRLSLEAVRAAGNAVSKNPKEVGKPAAAGGVGGGGGFRRRDDRRLTRLMLTVFCSFLVCFLPLTLFNAMDNLGAPPLLQLLSSVLAWASAVINPFIYAATNRQYRAAYRRLLCGCGADQPSASAPSPRTRLHPRGLSLGRATSDSGSATATTAGRVG